MTVPDAGKRIADLRDLLNRANEAYYQQAAPLLSDREYDRLLEELDTLEREHGLMDPDSPTRRVGGAISGKFPQVLHPIPCSACQIRTMRPISSTSIGAWPTSSAIAISPTPPS